MDFLDIEFPELPSIAPDLIFQEEPLPTADTISSELTPAQRESLTNLILDDHAYAKPYPLRFGKGNMAANPRKVLKLHKNDFHRESVFKRGSLGSHFHGSEDEDEIDVVGVDDGGDNEIMSYDHTKAQSAMNEVENYLNSLWKNIDKDDEERISRTSWSKEQGGLFDVVYKVILNYQLAKLAYSENANEPIHRRLALDKATKRMRSAFGSVTWDPKLVVWLHGILVDGLGSSLFICYLEILQSLKRKTPAMFERILSSDKTASDKELSLPNLVPRLKKYWDPSVGLKSNTTIEKLPSTPFLIMVPSGPTTPHQSTKRNRFWNNQLAEFSKVVPISVPAYGALDGCVIKHFLEHIINAIRTKIIELRDRFPDRPIVLIGWGVGSLISLKVGTLDKVDAVICLGLPTNGIDGDASEGYWKGLAEIDSPALFFLGTHAQTNSISKTEKLREQMKKTTSLVLIKTADELLRLTTSQKKLISMTQNMLDRLIQDQIYDFLKDVLYKPKRTATPPSKDQNAGKRRKKKGEQKGESKRKKKAATIKAQSVVTEESNFPLLPLDVSISSHSSTSVGSGIPDLGSQGLLTTGTVYTSIPLTDLYNDPSTSVTSIIQNANDIMVDTKGTGKKVTTKEKARRGRGRKKAATFETATKVTSASVESPVTGVIGEEVLMPGDAMQNLRPITFQRIPSGSVVLSGAPGQVRLQGAANIVYLQQTSNGTTQLLSPNTITPISNNVHTTAVTSSPLAANPPKINIVPSSNFRFNPVTTASNTNKGGLSAVISAGGCGNLVFTPSQSPTSDGSPAIETESSSIGSPLSINTGNADVLKVDQLASSSASALPGSTSTITTHLSANDIRYLANLIAQHNNSRPGSPSSGLSSPIAPLKLDGRPQHEFGEVGDSHISFATSSTFADTKTNVHMSAIPALFDKKVGVASSAQGNKRQPTVVQRASSAHPKDMLVTMKTPRLTSNVPVIHVTTVTSSTKSSAVGHKLPATLTIPFSRLQANFNLPSSRAKSVNDPQLSSSCVPHSSSTIPRIAVAATTSTSSAVRSNVGGILLAKTDLKSPNKGNSPSPITLHIPQSSFKDPKMLSKAVSDVKVVGVLNQQSRSQMSSLVNLSALRSISNPSSPQLSPTNLPRGDLNSQDNASNLVKTSSALLSSSACPTTRSLSSSGKTGNTAFLGKLFCGPRSIVDPTWGKVNIQRNPSQVDSTDNPDIDSDDDGEDLGKIDEFIDEDDEDDTTEDNDVDFAISPASPGESNFGTVYINKPLLFNHPKQSNVTKIVYAPTQANERRRGTAAPANIIDIARAKLRETQLRPPEDIIDSTNLEESAAISDSKLRFEPLKISSSRVKLSSVLSRRDSKSDNTGAITVLHEAVSSNSAVCKSNSLPVAYTRSNESQPYFMANNSSKSSIVAASLPLKSVYAESLSGQDSVIQGGGGNMISTTNGMVSTHIAKLMPTSSQSSFPMSSYSSHPISEHLKVSTSAQNMFNSFGKSDTAGTSAEKFSMTTGRKATPFDDAKSPEDLFRSIESKLPFLRSSELTQVNTRSKGGHHQNNQGQTSVVTRRGRGKRTRSSAPFIDKLEGKKTNKKRQGASAVASVSKPKRGRINSFQTVTATQGQISTSFNGAHMSNDPLKRTDFNTISVSGTSTSNISDNISDNIPNVISADDVLQNICTPNEDLISASSVYDILHSLQVPSTSVLRADEDARGGGDVDHNRTFGSIDPSLIPPLANIDTTIVNKPVGKIAPLNDNELDLSASSRNSEPPFREVSLPSHMEVLPSEVVSNVSTMVNKPILSSVFIPQDNLSSCAGRPGQSSPPALAVIESHRTRNDQGLVPSSTSTSSTLTMRSELKGPETFTEEQLSEQGQLDDGRKESGEKE